MNLRQQINHALDAKRTLAKLTARLYYEFDSTFLEQVGVARLLKETSNSLSKLSLSEMEGLDAIMQDFDFCRNPSHACPDRIRWELCDIADSDAD